MGHKQQSTATHTLMDPNTRTNNFALLCFVIPLIFKPLKNTLQCLDDQNPQRFQGLFNSFWHLHIRDQALHLLHVGARLSSSTTVYTHDDEPRQYQHVLYKLRSPHRTQTLLRSKMRLRSPMWGDVFAFVGGKTRTYAAAQRHCSLFN